MNYKICIAYKKQESMFSFLNIGLFDILDILLVAFIFTQIYRLVKGTAAVNIFIGIAVFYLSWLIVRALNMELVSSIMGQFMGMGVLALLILFQQEVRRFLLLLGSKYKISRFFDSEKEEADDSMVNSIVDSCRFFSTTYTGALIVFEKNTSLSEFIASGVTLNADITEEIIENIFFKNTPLHDGAMIIRNNKIVAARCILPVTDRQDIPGSMGLRHRAALGMSAVSDAHIVIVSEETGKITYVKNGEYRRGISSDKLRTFLSGDFKDF